MSSTKQTNKPNTVLDKIVIAIRALQNGPKGASRSAIGKYLQSEYSLDNANALKTALKKGVASGTLVQTGQSFRVAADPVMASPEIASLETEDVMLSSNGPSAQHGDTVTVAYEGTLEDGYQFDKATSFTFVLGEGDVIKGWDLGLVGMHAGGSRKLVVPPRLAYGKRGCKPDIPPDATLRFLVTMKAVKSR